VRRSPAPGREERRRRVEREEAIRKLLSGAFDLVTLDVEMPASTARRAALGDGEPPHARARHLEPSR
jgi:CheY-like chemotaxis protein